MFAAFRLHPLAGALMLASGSVMAQVPDAGRLQQEMRPPLAPPAPAPALQIQPPAATGDKAPAAGGVAVQLRSVRIEGLEGLLPEEQVLAALGPVTQRSFDLAGLRALAAQVAAHVRAAGYPFAHAWLPPQDLSEGTLRIAVLPGRYGEVRASDERVQPWLAPLRSGEPIAEGPLERQLLLLSDQPGVRVQSLLKPGQAVGSGDLQVDVQAAGRPTGEVFLDNHGNRYAGRERLGGAIDFAGLATFGDRLALRGSVSSEGTWQGIAAYALPLGYQGWRAEVSAARTSYELGKEFASLGAQGTADTLAAGVSYPIVRSRAANLRATAMAQARRLHDERSNPASDEARRSRAVVLALAGDRTDGTGVTWGQLGLTAGRLKLDAAQGAADAASARTAGSFTKLTLDVARLQALAPGWTLYGRLSGQWASKNLDSSEKLVLGGANGARAWPSGEAAGDEGWLGQVELRWRSGAWEPYVFLDGGKVRINRKPWAAAENGRSLAGAGLGVRYDGGGWHVDAALAWRDGNRRPQTEPDASQPQGWLKVGWRF